MERKIPRNVRQIGNVSDNPKIYVEDYVDTFFGQLCDRAEDKAVGAFLIGEIDSGGEDDCVYISGAIQMYELVRDESGLKIEEDTWKNAYEDCKRYFGDARIIGWFLSAPGMPARMNEEILRVHEKAFPETHSIFIIREPREREESFYANKFNDLMKIGGYYIYYEKNPAMQNYMITARRRNGLATSEWVEDGAARSFRNMIRAKGESEGRKQSIRFTRIASSFLTLAVLAMGITMLNSYDKIRAVQKTLEEITETPPGEGGEEASDETAQRAEHEASDKTAQKAGDEASDKKAQKAGEEASDETAQTAGKASGKKLKDISDESPEDAGTEQMQKETAVSAQEDRLPHIGMEAEEAGKTSDSEKNLKLSKKKKESKEPEAAEDAGQEEIAEGADEDIYVVKRGDTLVSISRKIYGNDRNIDAICRMNGLEENDLIYIGQKLLLP